MDEKHKALFRFLHRVNREPLRIAADDMVLLRALGWNDEALYSPSPSVPIQLLITAGLMHGAFMRTNDEAHRQAGKRTAAQEYVDNSAAARPKPVAS